MVCKGIPITGVSMESIAADLNISSGDFLLDINGQQPEDIIDYRYLVAGERVTLSIRKPSGDEYIYEIDKEYDEDLGLQFASATFSGIKPCRNQCLFCFVDQMPPGMRKSLYIKDDDYRLSFLEGNFITLTNLTEEDFQRIIDQHLSPLYISVHTVDPHLRKRLLGNNSAGLVSNQLQRLAEGRIEFHAQVVLIPGVNDGFYLEETVAALGRLWPWARSLALVPVGLTYYRKNLHPLCSYTSPQAKELISWARDWQKRFRGKFGSTFLYLADEFYILAEEVVPEVGYYDDFPQLENGVGLLRLFLDELKEISLPQALSPPGKCTLVTGISAAGAIEELALRLQGVKGLEVKTEVVPNSFFGDTVTVAGLLTGHDLLKHLAGKNLGEVVFLSEDMVRRGSDLLLDNHSLEEVGELLNTNFQLVSGPADVAQRLWRRGD